MTGNSGTKYSKQKLNHTLKKIVELLHLYKVDNWFIGYGTLLGIVRENSCINNDDDIDLIIDKQHSNIVKSLLSENGFHLTSYELHISESEDFLKTIDTDDLCSVDFYCATVDKNGDFHDKWEKVIWSNCYIDKKKKKLIEIEWEETKLYLPNLYESKLTNRYCPNWRVPQDKRGDHVPFRRYRPHGRSSLKRVL